MGGWVRAPHYAPLAVQTSSWAAAQLPDGALLHPSGEEEIYDDVESVELLRRDRSFPPPPAFRPPLYNKSFLFTKTVVIRPRVNRM